jgi:arylsulfatase A-like enzyme
MKCSKYKKLVLPMICLLLFGSCNTQEKLETNVARPNIILIMGDDMGYSDLGCYGSEINTPNLDNLAATGLRFTQFYNAARCCPTRASLLTGLSPQQAGIGHMVNNRGTEAFRGDLSNRAVTIAEVLKGAGYSTYMSGKWHVTPYPAENKQNPSKHNWPRQRGFDKFFGMISGAGSHYDPRSLVHDNEFIAPEEGFYTTTAFTDYATKCIDEHQSDNPYFLYVSYTAPHWPLQAPQEVMDKYKGAYDKGWDDLRRKRAKKMREMGLIKSEWEMTPRDSNVPEWSDQTKDREWELANMEVYAAMVDYMDEGIGRIINTLKAKGEFDNTLIFFLQDNGACAEELGWIASRPEIPLSEQVPMDVSELQTMMVPMKTREGKPVKLMRNVMPGPSESYTAYGLPWANASNTPFREYKHWVHEGGISTPLIVHWPEGFNKQNEFRNEPAHLIDIMATCVDVAGANYPSSYNEQSIIPMEGVSLVPAFDDQDLGRKALFWEHEGNRAVRMGKWKLVSRADDNSLIWDKTEELNPANWELYDMDNDRTELHDLSGDQPELLREMAGMWLEWAKRTKTIPRPN